MPKTQRKDAVHVGAAITPALKKRLNQYADQKGISTAAVIRWALEDYLNKSARDRAA